MLRSPKRPAADRILLTNLPFLLNIEADENSNLMTPRILRKFLVDGA